MTHFCLAVSSLSVVYIKIVSVYCVKPIKNENMIFSSSSGRVSTRNGFIVFGSLCLSFSGTMVVLEQEIMLDGTTVSAAFDSTMDMGIVGTTAGTLWYINWSDNSSIRLVSGHKTKVPMWALGNEKQPSIHIHILFLQNGLGFTAYNMEISVLFI